LEQRGLLIIFVILAIIHWGDHPSGGGRKIGQRSWKRSTAGVFCRDFAGILPILATVDQGLGIDGTFHVHGTLTITP
jgi:hypothetical protein